MTTPETGDPGQCIVTSERTADGGLRLRVDRADPRVLISSKLLVDLKAPAEGVSLTIPLGSFSFVGSVLRIEAVNRTVVYRIVDRAEGIDGYIGEWPD